MKTTLIIFCLVLFSAFAKAQDSTEVKVPKIYVKAYQGESTIIKNTSVKLVQVIEDSRCPKNVQCVWAGQAKVEVEITDETGGKITREITIAGGAIPAIYENNGLEIIIKGLSPYPATSSKINAKDYYLLVEIKN